MTDPYEDLGNARSPGKRPKVTPPPKPNHRWIFKAQQHQRARHECARCGAIRIRTMHATSAPTLKYITAAGDVQVGRSPPCA